MHEKNGNQNGTNDLGASRGALWPDLSLAQRTLEPMTVDARLGLVLEESRATLRQQQSDLQAFRSQAGSLLSFAGLAAGVLGGLAIRDDAPLHGWTYAAAGCFAAVVLLVLFVLMPREFTFSNNAATMLTEWDLETRSEDDTAKHLAQWLAKHADRNQPKIDWMGRAYSAAMLGFVAELVFLFLDLNGR